MGNTLSADFLANTEIQIIYSQIKYISIVNFTPLLGPNPWLTILNKKVLYGYPNSFPAFVCICFLDHFHNHLLMLMLIFPLILLSLIKYVAKDDAKFS